MFVRSLTNWLWQDSPADEVAAPPPSPTPSEAAADIADALSGFDAHYLAFDGQRVIDTLSGCTTPKREAIGESFHRREGHSLRTAINCTLGGDERRAALAAFEGAVTRVVDKVMALRSAGAASTADLINRHAPTHDNKVELWVDGVNAYPKMLEAIGGATSSINMSFFLFEDDSVGNAFADALIDRARAGVNVRLMLDAIGSHLLTEGPEARLVRRLRAAGVEVIVNHPVAPSFYSGQLLSRPDHRKLIVVDGKQAFIGGMNVADRYHSQFHDLMTRVRGGAVPRLQAEFLMSWIHRGGTLDPEDSKRDVRERYFPKQAPAGTSTITVDQSIPRENNEIRQRTIESIDGAKSSIQIHTPYFGATKVVDALARAARRGVDVTVILPSDNDSQMVTRASTAAYPKLLDAGVKLYHWPGFNHGKVMLIDGERAIIGSANLDGLSQHHIYEMNIVIDDPKVTTGLQSALFAKDVPRCAPITKEALEASTNKSTPAWSWLGDYV